jgi:hypothetical protein
MRLIKLSALIALIGAAWWFFNPDNQFKDMISQYVENGEILTLEAKFTPDQVMEANRHHLIADNQRSFKETTLKYYPYLLMDVKYLQSDKKSREGVILWGLVDGEMVLNTDNFDKTHGFEDAINANATATDFKILNALAKNKGSLSYDELQKELKLDSDILEPWIDSARKKYLIVQKGNQLQLHFEDPKILVTPQTQFKQWIVSKPYNYDQRLAKKYSNSQIERISKAAFGSDFTIRNIKEVYLPVYNIEVQNPDGSIMASYWNALTGQRINPSY